MNKTRPTQFCLIALALVLSISTASTSHAAIFGNDNRQSLPLTGPILELGRATAIGVLTGVQTWKPSGANPKIQALSLDVDPPDGSLCTDERFRNDSSLAYACTGFLIAPDLLLTAGHCQVNVGVSENESEQYCKVYDWLFDYQTDQEGYIQTNDIPADRLYHCKQILYAVNDEHAPFHDYAIVRLDRPVTGRQPLKLSTKPASVGDSVSMIGYPLGSPAKFADEARITANNPLSPAYLTDLDSLDGNSGSPVFNQASEVVGILISGSPAELFHYDSAKSCRRTNVCKGSPLTCLEPPVIQNPNPLFQSLGSDVLRIDIVRERLNKLGL